MSRSLRRGCTRAALAAATLAAGLFGLDTARAGAGGESRSAEDLAGVPVLAPLTATPASELRQVVERFASDRSALFRRYDAPYSSERRKRLRSFYSGWQSRLRELDFDGLSHEGKIDYLLLENRIRYDLYLLEREEKRFEETEPLVPFAGVVVELQEARRALAPVDPKGAAGKLAELVSAVSRARGTVESQKGEGRSRRYSPVLGARAASTVDTLRSTLERWYRNYAGYDPLFTWWAADPHRKADEALRDYAAFLRERVVGVRKGEEEPILGDPIGAEGLKADLAVEMLPYAPRELIAIAEREFAWCEAELKRASRDMGLGDDWKAALERVKTRHVEPGRQPELIRELAKEAIDFVEQRDLLTVPPLAKEVWRLEMMSPESQRVSPFFTGGEVIRVSFPTDGMTHEEKMMSMRGNNIHFSRATVHHELIPGHHLQQFMTSRYNSHRNVFSTPFWTEGWALYWEMLLWDQGFPKTPEDRIGMLFWRTHRAARILFSLRCHLGTMTPKEAIEFLVDRVGHERANATAEVRRSFNGSYPPLYQAAYMLGGLQFRALHRDLVGSGRMTNRQFHDAIIQGGNMPVEMVRARLTGMPLAREFAPAWRFGEQAGAAKR